MPKTKILEELRAILEGSDGLLEMPHWDFEGQASPLPGDPRRYGTLDFQLEKQKLPPATYKRLAAAFITTGFVGETKHGWLFFSNGPKGLPELAAATADQVARLPHLPDGWEKWLLNTA